MKENIKSYNERALDSINYFLDYWMLFEPDNYIDIMLNSIKEDIDLLEYYFSFINWILVDKNYIYNSLLLKSNTRKKCL